MRINKGAPQPVKQQFQVQEPKPESEATNAIFPVLVRTYGDRPNSEEMALDMALRLNRLAKLANATADGLIEMAKDPALLKEVETNSIVHDANHVRRLVEAPTPKLLFLMIKYAGRGVGNLITACPSSDTFLLAQGISESAATARALFNANPKAVNSLRQRANKRAKDMKPMEEKLAKLNGLCDAWGVGGTTRTRQPSARPPESTEASKYLSDITKAGVIESREGSYQFKGEAELFPLHAVAGALKHLPLDDPRTKALLTLVAGQLPSMSLTQIVDASLFTELLSLRRGASRSGMFSLLKVVNHALAAFGENQAASLVKRINNVPRSEGNNDNPSLKDAINLVEKFVEQGAYSTAINLVWHIESQTKIRSAYPSEFGQLQSILYSLLPSLQAQIDIPSILKADELLTGGPSTWSPADLWDGVREMTRTALTLGHAEDVFSICTGMVDRILKQPDLIKRLNLKAPELKLGVPTFAQQRREGMLLLLSVYGGLAQVPRSKRTKAFWLLRTAWTEATSKDLENVCDGFDRPAKTIASQLVNADRPSRAWLIGKVKLTLVERVAKQGDQGQELGQSLYFSPNPNQIIDVLACYATTRPDKYASVGPKEPPLPSIDEAFVCSLAALEIPSVAISLFDDETRKQAAIKLSTYHWSKPKHIAQIILQICPQNVDHVELLSPSIHPVMRIHLADESPAIRTHLSSRLDDFMSLLPPVQTLQQKVARFVYLKEVASQLVAFLMKTTDPYADRDAEADRQQTRKKWITQFALVFKAFTALLPDLQGALKAIPESSDEWGGDRNHLQSLEAGLADIVPAIFNSEREFFKSLLG